MSSLPPSSGFSSPERRSDRILGLAIVFGTFCISLAISYWARKESRPEAAGPMAPASSEGVVGWPSHVDPGKNLARARQLTRRPLFKGFIAEHVPASGAIDPNQGASLKYVFQAQPRYNPEPGAGGAAPRLVCGVQSVSLSKQGLAADPPEPTAPCAFDRQEPLPDPHCSLESVWEKAKARGVDPNGFAKIEYYRSFGGPALRFESAGIRFSLYGDCSRELEGHEAAGQVP